MKMKNGLGILLCFAIAVLLQSPILAQSKVYKVGILQMVKDLDSGVEGFKEGMKKLGYIEGKNIEYEYQCANAIMDKVIEYANQFAAGNKDLIFASSTPVSKILKDVTSKMDKPIPVVFTPVSDPVNSKIVAGWKSSENNLTGVASGVNTGRQLEILTKIVPGIKRVMVISKKGDASSEEGLQAIVAKAKDLSVDLVVERPVLPVDIAKILSTADFSNIQAIQMPPDTMVGRETNRIYEATRKYKIPIIVHSFPMLEAGGFLAYTSDYYFLGMQVAKQADKILKNNIPPSQIPVEEPAEYFLELNGKIAKEFGITIPPEYLKKARRVLQ